MSFKVGEHMTMLVTEDEDDHRDDETGMPIVPTLANHCDIDVDAHQPFSQ